MKKIIAIGASNSQNSINRTFASFTANQVEEATVTTLDLNNYEMPIYGSDYEAANGIPQAAHDFVEMINSADAIVLSLAEHNGNYTVAFKNIFDWASRINQKIWNNKPMLLLATSPGGRGGATVLNMAANTLPYFGANITGTFSLPSFYENFKEGAIQSEELNTSFQTALNTLVEALQEEVVA